MELLRKSYWSYSPHQAGSPKPKTDKAAIKYRVKAYARLKTILRLLKKCLFDTDIYGLENPMILVKKIEEVPAKYA